jgi:hypothetical protein
MKEILHPQQLHFLLVSAVWVTDIFVPHWSSESTTLYVMGGFMYLVDEWWFLKK